jgi:hypothetical protein
MRLGGRSAMVQRLRPIAWQSIRTRLILGGIALAFMAAVPADTPGGNSLNDRVLGRARNVLFNYVAWEAEAIADKLSQQTGISAYLTEAERSRYVHDYLKLVGKLQDLNSRINALYTDPAVRDPASASADLRAQRDAVRAEVDRQQPLAESIIEGQVASVLRDEGFATLGEVLPAVSSHITELPMLLVVSPRDRIRFDVAVNVINLSADQMTALEDSIDRAVNVSSLIVPLGGLSLYPSMVIQSPYAASVFEVVAHEWTHHYLYFFPLGLTYAEAADTRTINETTATLLGKEVARKTIERFYQDYPDILAQLPKEQPKPQPGATPQASPTPPAFDYGAVMNQTRVIVDLLLRFKLIVPAELFMERQRLLFVAHGYPIRKLNQAYFAFYGGYQSPGTGAGGADPIGPAITEIRERSKSLKAWLETMRSITSRDQLLAVRDALEREDAQPR